MSIRPLLTVVQKRASYGLADCGHVIRHSGYYHHTIIIIYNNNIIMSLADCGHVIRPVATIIIQ